MKVRGRDTRQQGLILSPGVIVHCQPRGEGRWNFAGDEVTSMISREKQSTVSGKAGQGKIYFFLFLAKKILHTIYI